MKKSKNLYKLAKYFFVLLVLLVLSLSVIGSSSSSYVTTATQYGEVSSVTPYVLTNKVRVSFYRGSDVSNYASARSALYTQSGYVGNSGNYVLLEDSSNATDYYGSGITNDNLSNFIDIYADLKGSDDYGTFTDNSTSSTYTYPLVVEKDTGGQSNKITTINIAPIKTSVTLTVYFAAQSGKSVFYYNGTNVTTESSDVSSGATGFTYSSVSGHTDYSEYTYQVTVPAGQSMTLVKGDDAGAMIFMIVLSPVTEIAMSGVNSMQTSGNTTLTAKVTSSVSGLDATWSSSDTDIVTVSSSTTSGTSNGDGTYSHSVTLTGSSTNVGSATITVEVGGVYKTYKVSVGVSVVDSGGSTSSSVASGTVGLTVTHGLSNATIVWSSDNTAVATVAEDSDNKNATVTAVSTGYTNITATVTSGSTVISASYTIYVQGSYITSTANYVDAGETVNLTAVFIDSSGLLNGEIEWSSSDTGIATVSGTTTTATVKGISTGKVTITAKTTDSNGNEMTTTTTISVPSVLTYNFASYSGWSDVATALATKNAIVYFDNGIVSTTEGGILSFYGSENTTYDTTNNCITTGKTSTSGNGAYFAIDLSSYTTGYNVAIEVEFASSGSATRKCYIATSVSTSGTVCGEASADAASAKYEGSIASTMYICFNDKVKVYSVTIKLIPA